MNNRSTDPDTSRRGRIARFLHDPTIARVILALALSFTAASWYISRQAVERKSRQEFEFQAEEVLLATTDRMLAYEQMLWGGAALFNANEGDVDRQAWERYVDTLNLQVQWPGVQGIGYATVVDPGGLDKHIDEIRSEGFPDYTVKPEGVRDEYTAIVYLEPFDFRNQRAFGFDMWSNDIRQEAMRRASETGKAASSGVITLVQETEEDVQKGFLVYVPVYRQAGVTPSGVAPSAALEGWVYAPFRAGDLMSGLLPADIEVDFELFSGDIVNPDSLLYQSRLDADNNDPKFTTQREIDVQGQRWTLIFSAGSEFGGQGLKSSTLVAMGGIAIDLLLFYLILVLGRLEERATKIASGMTTELRSAKFSLEERSHQLEMYANRLEISNEELEQFAYVAAHDLQEPLRTLGSYSSLLSDRFSDRLDEDGERWLKYIEEGSVQMSTLLRELLQYSTADGEVQPMEQVDLNAVVVLTLQNLDDMITANGAEVHVASLPSVEGDFTQLVRLFQNLIGNAIKYRAADTPAQVWIGGESQGDSYYRISVKDNGLGIKPEYHERVFEIFRRVGARSDYEGNGIGLAICRKIVRKHGGEIGVESSLGSGSEFWFTLAAKGANQSATLERRKAVVADH